MLQAQEPADLIYDPDGNVVAVARINGGLTPDDTLEIDSAGRLVLTRKTESITLSTIPAPVLAMARAQKRLLFRDLTAPEDRSIPLD